MYIQETKRTKKYRESTKNHQKITESTNKEPTKTTQKQEYLKKNRTNKCQKVPKRALFVDQDHDGVDEDDDEDDEEKECNSWYR